MSYRIRSPTDKDAFGSGIGLSLFADKVAIGAVNDNSFAGRVWVFDSDTGAVAFTLENPNPESTLFDWFGWSVAANEDIIAVGAREDGTSGVQGSGTVYIFDSQTGALRNTLFSPQLETNGEFGRSVALTLDGDVLVGAWGTSVNGIEAAGHAYLFDGESGTLLLDMANPEPTSFASFGWSVSAAGNRIVVGAVGAQPAAMPSSGAVYVFEAIPEPSSIALLAALVIAVLVVQVARTVKCAASRF